MNAIDLAENTLRRAAGLTVSIGLLKLAKLCRIENKEIQALAYIAGKEIGFTLVDGYHETTPEKKAYKAETQHMLNQSLNHTYEVWTSILGKSKGEWIVGMAHSADECRAALYENFGDAERKYLDKLPKFTLFKDTLNSASDFFSGHC